MDRGTIGQTEGELRRQERERRWQGHLAAWRRSGWNQAEYCRQHGLAPADFSWWKRELARRNSAAQSTSQFVPVQVVTRGTEATGCEVVLCNGRRLRIGTEVDPGWVAKLAAALEGGVSC